LLLRVTIARPNVDKKKDAIYTCAATRDNLANTNVGRCNIRWFGWTELSDLQDSSFDRSTSQ
jgi:hypothetical protein